MKNMKIFFLVLFAIQLAIPLSMIIRKELVLNRGEIVKFQVLPVDPYDAFRGKYLSIGIVENRIYTAGETFRQGQKVNVLISVDSEGFGRPTGISTKDAGEVIYVKCIIDYIEEDYATVNYPFDRYYINEDYSQLGESLYNKYSRGNRDDAYVTVRIKNGNAVLEDMYLSGIEINRFIRNELDRE